MIMMPGDKKKTATIIVSGLGGAHKDKKEGKADDISDHKPSDSDYGIEAAMEKMISAVEAKDAKMAASYLKDAVEMCFNECNSKDSAKHEPEEY